jgi:octaprenyl-diphosphate synthase
MIKLKDIIAPIENDFVEFNDNLKNATRSQVNLVNVVIDYAMKNKGKQLRPMLCLLSAKLISNPNKSSITAASLIEMLHVATLIHDDIVDDSPLRRGWPSVKSVWKNKISLLLGDYIFSQALSNMIKLKNFDALEILSNTANRLSQGELLQMERSKTKDIDEATYLKMISDKTASLFSASSEIGAITVEASHSERNALKIFGEKLGIAFQIKDDLFDLVGNQDGLGKPTGFDVKKNMITLPFIHLMSTLKGLERFKIISKLKFYAKKGELRKIESMINQFGSMQYAENLMIKISNEAIKELDIFSESDAKKSLILLVKYNLERTK